MVEVLGNNCVSTKLHSIPLEQIGIEVTLSSLLKFQVLWDMPCSIANSYRCFWQ